MPGLPVLGVDAGGSATRAVLVRDGEVVTRYSEGPLNLLLHADAFERLVLLIKQSGAGAAGLGLAGLRGQAEGEQLQRRLTAATGARVAVADDTEAALMGAFEGGAGIVVIAGTGSNAFGRDANGRAARAGGYGFLLGDDGSAYSIANELVRAALRSYDGTGPKSEALERAVLDAYSSDVAGGDVARGDGAGIDFDGIVRLVHSAPGDRQLVAPVAHRVMQLDDPLVRQIVDRAADALAALAHALRARLGAELPVAMHGGIFQDAAIRERFVAATGAVPPALAPEFGAVLLAERDLETGRGAGGAGWAE